jgi:hypothetical protein
MKIFEPKQIISFRAGVPFSEHGRLTDLMQIETNEFVNLGPPAAVRHRKLQGKAGPSREGWSIVLSRRKEVDILLGLNDSFRWLEKKKHVLRELRLENIKIELYISIWHNGKLGFTILPEHLLFMAEFEFDLSFDCSLINKK